MLFRSIEPKMSFGTGHHATTALMAEQLLKFSVKMKAVLDMGCGTSLLAILAAKMGARDVTAIDIDDWCIMNSLENIIHNHVEMIHVDKGDANSISEKTFDVILANINRNVLLRDIPAYARSLPKNGILVVSGFLQADIDSIDKISKSAVLIKEDEQILNDWAVIRYIKK